MERPGKKGKAGVVPASLHSSMYDRPLIPGKGLARDLASGDWCTGSHLGTSGASRVGGLLG